MATPDGGFVTTTRPPLPLVARQAPAAIGFRNLVLVAGGAGGSDRTFDVYDPHGNTWWRPEGGIAVDNSRQCLGFVLADRPVLACAEEAQPDPTTVSLLDPDTCTWSQVGSTTDHRPTCVAVINDRAYFFGFYPAPSGVRGARSFILDGGWAVEADLPAPRDGMACVAVDGKVWLMGGGAYGEYSADVWVYDPATQTYSDGGALPYKVNQPGAVRCGTRVHLVGGSPRILGDGGVSRANVLTYDLVRPELGWVVTGSTVRDRIWPGLAATSRGVVVAGGWTGVPDGGSTTTAEIGLAPCGP